MNLRIAQINPVLDPERRTPAALLDAWWTLRDIAQATARAGATVAVFQPSHASETIEDGLASYRFVATSRLSMPRRLAAAVRDWAPDVIHLNGFESPFLARALGLLPAPLLAQDHASHPGRWLRRWGYGHADGAAFTAMAQAMALRTRGELRDATRVFVIPENASHFLPEPVSEARTATGVTGDPALLWVGHLDANKDPLTILHAVRRLLPRLPQIQLWCAFGDASLRPTIDALLREQPALAAHVHLLGRVPHAQIQRLASACDLYVGASRREGSGYALIEALACGLTPVVSDIPAFRALTGSGAVGALVPVGDVQGFADAILDQHRRRHPQSRSQVRAHFERTLSFDVVGRALVAAYRSLLSEARCASR